VTSEGSAKVHAAAVLKVTTYVVGFVPLELVVVSAQAAASTSLGAGMNEATSTPVATRTAPMTAPTRRLAECIFRVEVL
jgi:hypothetical protein